MENITIKLDDFLTMHSGVTPDEGKPVYKSIIDAFENGYSVTLDFAGVTLLTTAFLNVVIGDLYENHTSEELKTKLRLVNHSDSTAIRIKKVTDNAKLFYSNKEAYSKGVEGVINEHS